MDELCDNRAVWHKSCHLKFASAKIERARLKRKRDANDVRQGAEEGVEQSEECLYFCNQGEKWASTSANVRNGQRYKTNGN